MKLPPDLFQRFCATVQAERYLLLWRAKGQEFQVLEARGLDKLRVFTSEPVSVGLFQEVAESGKARWSEKMQDSSSTSLVLSGIKSYLCVPIRQEGGVALLYADYIRSLRGLSYTDFMNVHNLAQQLGPRTAQKNASPPPPPPPPKPEQNVEAVRLTIPEQANLLRSLATFAQAGIPILHGLHGLAEHAETEKLRMFCERYHNHLLRGGQLSSGARQLGRFDPLVAPLMGAAEQTGKLSYVLQMLAQHLEEKHRRILQLRGSLVYPAAVLACGLTLALGLPPFVLKEHLKAYAQNGPLPWPTQVLVGLGSPAFWVVAVVVLALTWRLRGRAYNVVRRLPGLKRLLSANLEVTLATTLALQLDAGVPLLKAIQVALEACGDPEAAAALPEVEGSLRQGDSLSQAISLIPGVRPQLTVLLVAGEEAGKVSDCLRWTARLSKLEFEQSLEVAQRLLEPFILLILGLIVGFIAVASLLPTLKLLS